MTKDTNLKTYPGICRVGKTDTQKSCTLAEWAVLAWLHGGKNCHVDKKSNGSAPHDTDFELQRLQQIYPKLRPKFELVFGPRVEPKIPSDPASIAGIHAHKFPKVDMEDATPADHNL